MRKICLGVLLWLCWVWPGLAAELTPAQATAVDQAVASLEAFFGRPFQVRLRSPELQVLLEQHVAAQSARMGMPMTLQISHFMLRRKGEESLCTLVLTPETPMREMLEPQANQMLESLGFSRLLAGASFDALGEGARVLKAGRAQGKLGVSRESAEALDLTIGFSGQTLLPGFKLSQGLFRISKPQGALIAIQLQDEAGKMLKAMVSYQEVKGLSCPAAMELRHNLGPAVAGVTLPPAMKIIFDQYRFAD